MTEARKVQLEIAVAADTSGVDDVKQAVQDLAVAAGQAGDQASKAFDGIGTGADASAQKVDAATRSMIGSIQRTTAVMEAGSRSSAKYFEALAAQRGIDPNLLRPYLQQLEEVSAAQQKVASVADPFALQHESAKLLVRDAEYVAFWTQALGEKDRAEKQHAADALFEQQHQSAKQLVKDSEYVRFWTQALHEKDQAERQQAGQSAFVTSLKAQAEAVGKTRTQLLELQAAQLGVSSEAAPYLKALRDAEQAAAAAGHATEQFGFKTAAAKRELLVLAHELSQGNIKNFGSSMLVLGERTGAASLLFSGAALTAGVLAGAVIALGVAAAKGADEMHAFQAATTLTGNAVGLSASGFTQMRDALAGIAGSKGAAAAALTEIAASGKIAGTSVQGIAEAAILMERATGQAVSKTVEQFAELAKAPAEASAKLNEQYHFLTAAVFAQIKALEDQGRASEAAKLAEDTYANALKDRAQSVISSAGLMEKAWHGVASAGKLAWDAMLGLGRAQSPAEALAAAAAQVAQLQAQLTAGPGPDRGASVGMGVPGLGAAAAGGGQQATAQRLAAARELLADAQRRVEIEGRNTQALAEQNRLQQLGIAFHQDDDKFLTKRQQEQKELTKAQVEGQELVNAGIITEEQLRTRLNGIRQKYIETTGQNEVAQIRAKTLEQQQLLARLQKQLATGDFSTPAELTEGEKKVIEIQGQLKTSMTDVARGQKLLALTAAEGEAAADKLTIAQKQQNKAYEDALGVLTKQADATSQQAESIQQQALAQEAANATFGKSKTAIEEATLAQLRLNLVQREAFDPAGSQKEIDAANRETAAVRAKTEAQERYVTALQKSEAQQIALQLTEGTRVSQEETATMQLQLSLVGQTAEVRDRILAQRKAELDLAKELAAINKSGATDAEKEELRAKARTKALIDTSNAAVKASVDQWQRASDEINNSLTDALLRGFESGQGFAANLRDSVKRMFSQLVLRPIIQGALAPVSSSLGAIGQSVVGGGGSALGGLGGLASIGGSVLGGMSLGNAGATLAANAAGTGIDGLMAATGAFGTAAGGAAAAGAGTGLLGAASAGLAAIGPVGWVALAALAAYSIFGNKGGGPKTESGAGIGVRTTGDVAGVANIIQSIQSQYGGMIKGLGGTPGQLDLGIFSAQDPKGTALTQLAFNASLNGQSIENRGARLGGIENVGRSPEELQAAIAGETERVVLSALQASNLTGAIGDYLKQLGDINALSDGAIAESLTRAQTIGTQQAQLQSTLFDLTHTALEKLTKTRQDERAAIDATNQALYDQVAQLQDLTTAAQTAAGNVDTTRTTLADAYQRESAALASVVQQHTNYADQLRKVRDSLTLGTDSGLSRAQITARAGQSFSSALSGALAGNTTSLDALGGAGSALVDAVKQSAHSPQEIAAAIARVQAGLTTAAASETARATMAQSQLDAMTQQLTALGAINTTVATVGDALTGYLQAINRNSAAQLALQTAQMQAAGTSTVTGDFQSFTDAAIAAAVAALSTPSTIPGHATGGIASGVSQVGERGREVLDFQTPARVYTNEQTEGMFASNAALEPLLRQVVELLQTARTEERMEAAAVITPLLKIDSRLKKFDTVGMPPVREATP